MRDNDPIWNAAQFNDALLRRNTAGIVKDVGSEAAQMAAYGIPVVGPALAVNDIYDMGKAGYDYATEREPVSVRPTHLGANALGLPDYNNLSPREYADRMAAFLSQQNEHPIETMISAANAQESAPITVEGQARVPAEQSRFIAPELPEFQPVDTRSVPAPTAQYSNNTQSHLAGPQTTEIDDNQRFEEALNSIAAGREPVPFREDDTSIGMMLDQMGRSTAADRGENYTGNYTQAYAGDNIQNVINSKMADQNSEASMATSGQRSLADSLQRAINKQQFLDDMSFKRDSLSANINKSLIDAKLRGRGQDISSEQAGNELAYKYNRANQLASIEADKLDAYSAAARRKELIAKLQAAQQGGRLTQKDKEILMDFAGSGQADSRQKQRIANYLYGDLGLKLGDY